MSLGVCKMEEELEEGEVQEENFGNGLRERLEEKEVGLEKQYHGEHNGMTYGSNSTPRSPPIQLMPRKNRPSKRDVHSLNYAFGEPRIDEAAKEAQDWFDSLSIVEEEEKNAKRNIFPHGLKYRSGEANLSPQMFERLQHCQNNQEPYDPPKNKMISTQRNSSLDVDVGLHEEDHCNRPENTWRGRRSAIGNNSTSVYAILHPHAEVDSEGCKRKKKLIEKNSIVKRNHLREHIAAIAEMSYLTHNFKEKEKKQEAKHLDAIKHWGGKNIPKKTAKRQQNARTNFVEKNMEAVTAKSAYVKAFKEEPRPDVLSPHKENLGRVPEYLRRIKVELAQEAERRAIEEAAKSFPPGRRLMSEANRRHILHRLETKHKELIQTLKSFPLIFDTPRQVQLKSNIEQQLRNIEASHSYYDNPKVFTSCLDINCPTCMHIDSHFFQDSLPRTPNSPQDDLWEHMACAAGIQKSPRRTTSPSFEKGSIQVDYRGIQGTTSLPRKRRNQEGEFYASPSKRQNISPQKMFHQFHNASPSSMWGICKQCSTTGQTTTSASHPE